MAKIYLSSTFSDLVEHRKAVYDALRRMRHDVIAMEHYVSADERPLDKSLKDVADCDIYVGIFAWRYGFIPVKDNPSQKSITELEYRKACELGKPCLIFLLAEDVPWPLTLVDMHTREGKRGRSIKALRKELAQEKIVNHFHNSEELATLASTAVTNHLKETIQGAIDTSLMMRLSYLESIYEHYKSVKLPIGPADGLSLLAIFQPLKLRNDPLAAEDLEREKRRKLLGEGLMENDEYSLGASLQAVTAENAEEALAKSSQKRIVVLGGPGTGKTTTLKHLVACAAKAALDVPENTDLPLPIFISLPDLARTNMGLQGYLPHIVDELKVDVSFANDLWQAIDAGCAFICLDSLDEVDPRLRGDIIERINTWTSDARNIWIVGSRFTEYKGGQFRRGQFSEWELQPMDATMRRELAQRLLPHLQDQFADKRHQTVTPATFAELLEKHPQAAAWGENPLLFSLAAIVFVKTGDLPSSRAALYREIIDAVLRMREHDATECELLLRTFTKLALWLHEKKGRTFTRRDLVTFLEDVQQRPWNDTVRIANRIIASGMMEVVAHDTYGFRHQTFQEYLAAGELARRLTHLDSIISKEAWNFIWSKRTYSRWTEILSLLVGVLLQQQGPEGVRQTWRWLDALIKQREATGGDPGDLGLLLVLKSLSECMGPEDKMFADMEELAEKIVLIWIEELLSSARSRHYRRVNRIRMPAQEISHFNNRVQKIASSRLIEALSDISRDVRESVVLILKMQEKLLPSLDEIRTLMHDDRLYVRSITIEVLGMFGEKAPMEELINTFNDTEVDIRQAAVEALGEQGERTPVEELIRMLHDESWSVRQAAVGALGKQGERTPIEELVRTLHDKVGAVRQRAVHVLGRQEGRVPIEDLVKVLCDAEQSVRRAAVDVLGRQGERAPVEELVRMLHDGHWNVRSAAVKALKGQGERVPIKEVVRVLNDADEDVRREAVRVLGEQGERVPIEELVRMLQDVAGSVYGVTVEVLEARGKRITMEEISEMLEGGHVPMRETAMRVFLEQESVSIEDLMRMLQDDDWTVRWATVEALGKLGERAPLEDLVRILQDEAWQVRCSTVRVLGEKGERAPLEELVRMLQDNVWNVRQAAVEALGKQRERAPLEELVRMLQDAEWDVRQEVVNVLGEMEQWLSLEELVKMLYDERVCMRWVAVKSLEVRGEAVPIEELVRMLQDVEWRVRRAAVRTLAAQSGRVPTEELVRMLYDVEWRVRLAAVRALERLEMHVSSSALVAPLGDEKSYVRDAAIDVLKKIAPQTLSIVAPEARAILLGEPASTVLGSIQQYFIIDVISNMGKVPPALLEKLTPLLDWPYWLVRLRAIQALSKIRRNIPDAAIRRLLEIRLNPGLQVIREAVDDALAEILSLEAGIEDD